VFEKVFLKNLKLVKIREILEANIKNELEEIKKFIQ
jgi:hypothetical protein